MHYEGYFSDLNAALRGVDGHFHQQMRAPLDADAVADGLCRLRLAVHEWMTNLLRHARFDGRRPEVRVRIRRRGALHLCTVEDNSYGFDLAAWLDGRSELARYVRTLPDGGMGLLLLEASTERVEYEAVGEHWNRLRFSVRARSPIPARAGDRKISEG